MPNLWLIKENEKHNKIWKIIVFSFFALIVTGIITVAFKSDNLWTDLEGFSSRNENAPQEEEAVVRRYNYETGQLERVDRR
ncbi:hypothetical protein K8R32_00500 [bacterium]|nr:hypothetical protein [bacterium]